jgi:hypothetical protein
VAHINSVEDVAVLYDFVAKASAQWGNLEEIETDLRRDIFQANVSGIVL